MHTSKGNYFTSLSDLCHKADGLKPNTVHPSFILNECMPLCTGELKDCTDNRGDDVECGALSKLGSAYMHVHLYA